MHASTRWRLFSEAVRAGYTISFSRGWPADLAEVQKRADNMTILCNASLSVEFPGITASSSRDPLEALDKVLELMKQGVKG